MPQIVNETPRDKGVYGKISNILAVLAQLVKWFSKLFESIYNINKILGIVFKFLPIIYTIFSIVLIIYGVAIIILYFFSNFNIIPEKYKNIVDKDTSQLLYSSLYLIQSFLMLSVIVYITYTNDSVTDTSSFPIITNIINSNTTGIIIIQTFLVSIIVIFCLLMSVISTSLTRGYYTLKSQDTNQKHKIPWWAKLIDMIMFGYLIIASFFLIIFFILKLFGNDNSHMAVKYKSELQVFFIIPFVYHISQAILKFIEDIISNNIISFITPSTEENKTLSFILNIILAITLWICAIPYALYYNLIAVIPTTTKVRDLLYDSKETNPVFYGIISTHSMNIIITFLQRFNIDISQIGKNTLGQHSPVIPNGSPSIDEENV